MFSHIACGRRQGVRLGAGLHICKVRSVVGDGRWSTMYTSTLFTSVWPLLCGSGARGPTLCGEVALWPLADLTLIAVADQWRNPTLWSRICNRYRSTPGLQTYWMTPLHRTSQLKASHAPSRPF